MDITAMREWFDILQDKYNTAGYTNAEKDEFLEDAMWNIINITLEELEQDKKAIARIKTLVRTDTVTAASVGGEILLKTNTADKLFKESDGSTTTDAPVVELSMSFSGIPVRHKRHGELEVANQNTYKAGSATQPYYTVKSYGYSLTGIADAQDVDVTYVAKPSSVVALPEHVHRKQVALALSKVAAATEAEMLAFMNENTVA